MKMVSPVIWQLSTAKNLEVIYGIDLKSFEALVPFHYLHGGPFQGPNDCLVDDYFAQSQHVKVGSTIEILNHNFRVAGIVEHGRGARKFLPINTLQELIEQRRQGVGVLRQSSTIRPMRMRWCRK